MVQATVETSPIACHAALLRIIAASLDAADSLQRSLDDERRALEQQDSDALGNAAAAKQECVTRLEALEKERAAASTAAGYPAGPEHMPALLSWCDGDKRIRDGWERFLSVAADCNRMNTANGAIIHLKRRHYAAALRIVSGSGSASSETYGPSGGTAAAVSSRALAEI